MQLWAKDTLAKIRLAVGKQTSPSMGGTPPFSLAQISHVVRRCDPCLHGPGGTRKRKKRGGATLRASLPSRTLPPAPREPATFPPFLPTKSRVTKPVRGQRRFKGFVGRDSFIRDRCIFECL